MYKLTEVKYLEIKSSFYTGPSLLLNLEIVTELQRVLVVQKMFYKTENVQLQKFLKENKITNFKELCGEIEEHIDIIV